MNLHSDTLSHRLKTSLLYPLVLSLGLAGTVQAAPADDIRRLQEEIAALRAENAELRGLRAAPAPTATQPAADRP